MKKQKIICYRFVLPSHIIYETSINASDITKRNDFEALNQRKMLKPNFDLFMFVLLIQMELPVSKLKNV
jgi:hypothetical protein